MLSGLSAISRLMHADDLDLMTDKIAGLRNKFIKWKDAYQSNGLIVNLGKTKVMVIGSITKDGMLTMWQMDIW